MNQPPTAPPIVPAWVDGRLQNIVSSVPGIHFENSMYGPLTAYLHTFFPPNRSFMVKPQGMLRPEPDDDNADIFSDISAEENPSGLSRDEILRSIQRSSEESGVARMQVDTVVPGPLLPGPNGPVESDILQNIDDSDGDGEPNHIPHQDTSLISNDSYGAGVKRTNKGIRYPDFIVVKATESLTDDTILFIVEVKKDDDSLAAARLQICTYLGMAAGKRRVRFLQGLLIMGEKSECYVLDSQREGGISAPVPFFTTSMRLKSRIHRIAVGNW